MIPHYIPKTLKKGEKNPPTYAPVLHDEAWQRIPPFYPVLYALWLSYLFQLWPFWEKEEKIKSVSGWLVFRSIDYSWWFGCRAIFWTREDDDRRKETEERCEQLVLFLRQQTSENLLKVEKRNEDLIFNHHFKSHRAALAFKNKKKKMKKRKETSWEEVKVLQEKVFGWNKSVRNQNRNVSLVREHQETSAEIP